jgi:hypothetical protein
MRDIHKFNRNSPNREGARADHSIAMTVPLCLRRDEFRLLLTHVEASSIVRNTNLHDLIQTEPGASGSASSIQTSSRLHVSRFCLANVIAQLCWRVASLVSRCGLSISSLNFFGR